MTSHSLKYLRITSGLLCILAFAALFCGARNLSWLAKLQLIPSLLALNLAVIALLAILTLVFGRLYCSVLCPLGISQDIVIWFRRRLSRRRHAGIFKYKKENKAVRYSFFALFAVLFIIAIAGPAPMSIAGILDPYSIFGRIAAATVVPPGRFVAESIGKNLAARGIYPFDALAPEYTLSSAVALVAFISAIVVFVFSITSGRNYCNTVCPAGTLLSFLSRFSLLHPVIDTTKCNGCGSCARHCKASCIDSKSHDIDMSRCVVCFDCINSCRQGAISYSLRRRRQSSCETPDASRRAFIVGVGSLAGSGVAIAADKLTDGGYAPLVEKKRRADAAIALPAGAISMRNLRSRCTACQLCISNCPEGILKPSPTLDGFMQPMLDFSSGYCRPECTLCSSVCPTGALKAITKEEKSSIKIGTACVDTALCLESAHDSNCGNCARHCPTGAITMVDIDDGARRRPAVDAERCIGCGACEYHCPSGRVESLGASHAAIYVTGIEQHRSI